MRQELLARLHEINKRIDVLPPGASADRLELQKAHDAVKAALDDLHDLDAITPEWEAQAKHALSETETLPVIIDPRGMTES